MGASLIPRPPGEVKSQPNRRKMEGELWVGDPASFIVGILGAGNPMAQDFRMAGLLTHCVVCEGSLGFCLFPALIYWDGLQSSFFHEGSTVKLRC